MSENGDNSNLTILAMSKQPSLVLLIKLSLVLLIKDQSSLVKNQLSLVLLIKDLIHEPKNHYFINKIDQAI